MKYTQEIKKEESISKKSARTFEGELKCEFQSGNQSEFCSGGAEKQSGHLSARTFALRLEVVLDERVHRVAQQGHYLIHAQFFIQQFNTVHTLFSYSTFLKAEQERLRILIIKR